MDELRTIGSNKWLSVLPWSPQKVFSSAENLPLEDRPSHKVVTPHSSVLQHIWDPLEGRFDHEFIPVLLYIPTLIAILILLCRLILLNADLRPSWMRPFVLEHVSTLSNSSIRLKSHKRRIPSLLIIVCVLGICSQAPRLLWPSLNVQALFNVSPWFVLLGLLCVDHSHTFQASVFTILAFVTTCEAIIIFETRTSLHWEDVFPVGGVIFSLVGLVICLNIPLRSPELGLQDIAPVGRMAASEFRSPEDSLTLWQFATVSWMAPLISSGYSRKLHDEDVWRLAYQFQHTHLHNNFRELHGSVVRRLLRANGLDLVTSCLLGVVELMANFSVPLLLQQLLRSMENPESPIRASITYALLSLAARLIASQSAVFGLWYSRRAYERSRGEMITMLHEKTLSRKIIGSTLSSTNTNLAEEAQPNDSGAQEGPAGSPKSMWTRMRRLRNLLLSPLRLFQHNRVMQEAKEPASKGKILNLMRNDVYEVAQRFWEFQNLLTKPLGLIFSVILVWQFIGWPCLFGVAAVILTQSVDALVMRKIIQWERLRRVTTDTKLQKISQFVEAIRHLRWYGWQHTWLAQIMDARQRELNYRVISQLLMRLLSVVNTLGSRLFPVAVFFAYTALAGLPLRIDIAFPALQLFDMLQSSMRDIPDLITVLLNASVAVGRINDFMNEEDISDERDSNDQNDDVCISNGSFSWPGHSELVLKNINVKFSAGVNIISGEVAAGKTALLQAILGELDKRGGEVARPHSMVAYCSQMPWLQNMSIRDNILFSSPYEPHRYKAVLEACALIPDLATFKHGDLSDIGENGIGLSGGQKARVALARAVYSKAKVVLLDDPISALDHQTSTFIVESCLAGPLMRDRTVILVTHRVELCHHLANTFVEMSNGSATLLQQSISSSKHGSLLHDEGNFAKLSGDKEDGASAPEKFMEEEHRSHGGVKFSVYWKYIKAGKLKWWAVLIFFLAIYRLLFVGQSWFLKEWGEAYQNQETEMHQRALFGHLPDPEQNIRPWLIGFLLFGIGQVIFFMFSQVFMVIIIFAAGRQMFRDIMHRVCMATFRFYDVTPVGRLMNRLTSDINTVDGDISGQFQGVAFLIISWVSSLVVIASVTPIFLIFSALLTTGFILIFLRFLPTSQSLRRLEMVSLSPLMSNFGALLDGLMTVRAFQAQYRFQARVIGVTDAFQKMDHFYWTLQAWLMYRFDALSAFSTFVLTLIAFYTGVSPGLTAFVLIAASSFVEATHSLCKRYGQLQMDFVSVERIVELLDLDQEPPGYVDPPAAWPSFQGDIVFEHVTIRYLAQEKPALEDVSFRIKGGSMTAVVGRTGSGKSTLALALLATIEPQSGLIAIDGIDISEVIKQSLRSRVTFLAQDPVLFPGSMRQNLDPLEEHSDEECSSVLERICGRHGWTIETQLDTGGKNLSQGQRQLVGLARAVLRRSAIIILDEATASIDMQTSMEIQQILRDEMSASTIITIAHRLEAVVNADYCIELSHGKVLRQGSASELLETMPRGIRTTETME